MKRYYYQTLCLCGSVLLLIFIVNYVVDPFNLNRRFYLNFDKENISYRMNYRLYKLIEFKNSPKSIILMGDSRCDNLKAEYFKRFGITDFYNFSYGGGSFPEIIDTFWFAAGVTKLKWVIIGLPFNIFNEAHSASRNMVPEASDVAQSPAKYYFSPFILKASMANIYHKLSGRYITTEKPAMSQEVFWKHQLGKDSIGQFYSQYRYPNNLLERVKDIATFCRQNEIVLLFIIPPTHIELQDKVKEYSLTGYYEKYKADLACIAEVADFDYPNLVTSNKANYLDPYHFDQALAIKIVQELINNTSTFSRRYIKCGRLS